MTYPHLLIREAIAFQVLVIALVIVALFWDAPLEQLANPCSRRIRPRRRGISWACRSLLHYFPPFVAGILIPTLVVIALIVIPYFNVNIEGEPLWARRPARNLRTFLVVVVALARAPRSFRRLDGHRADRC